MTTVQALLCAQLLYQGRQIHCCSMTLGGLAVLAALAAMLVGAHLAGAAFLMSFTVSLVQLYWSGRVNIDAALFRHLSDSHEADRDRIGHELDQGLVRLGLVMAIPANRSWDARSRGALGLLRNQARCLAVQTALLIAAVVILGLRS